MKIEIVVDRNPDGETILRYFKDGQELGSDEIEFIEYHVDPGAAGPDSEWVQGMATYVADASPAVRELVTELVEGYAR